MVIETATHASPGGFQFQELPQCQPSLTVHTWLCWETVWSNFLSLWTGRGRRL